MGVATKSTEEVGKIYLRAIQDRAPDFMPTAYLADGAAAFANAAHAIFDSIDCRLMCFTHVYKVQRSHC